MKRLIPWAAVFLAGLILGAGVLRGLETFTVDQELAQLKAEAFRLSAELRDRESQLAVVQQRLKEQSEKIHSELTLALDEADRILTSQGSAIDRLKRVLATLRQLRTIPPTTRTD